MALVRSTINSSTATLGGAGVFTGTFEYCAEASGLIVSSKSDLGPASIVVEWSADGLVADDEDNLVPVPSGGSSRSYRLVVRNLYYRVIYTNGPTPQGSMKLNTFISTHGLAYTGENAADVGLGGITDSAVASDADGTAKGHLRGLVKIFADVWDDANNRLNTAVGGTVPLPSGAATEATLATLLTEADFDTKAGAVDEAAPGTDTASSGHNGRLQRIAQRLTSLIALLPAALSGGGNLKVSLEESNASQAVTGTVTANAGTDLNTSALALETGGNLAAAAASLSVVDDWDESDRAKVNPIAGQAGVEGGSGAVSALTQRVTLATDVALPAGTNNIGDVDVLTLPSIPAGTNNIGDVDVLSIAAGDNNIGNVDVVTLPALPAGTNDVGTVQPYAQAGSSVMGVTSDITGTSNTSLIAAQGSGVRTYLTHVVIQNSHASTGTWVNVKDGTTTKYSVYCAAGGGGASLTLPRPLRGSENTAWQVACETTAANVRASASGYTSTV